MNRIGISFKSPLSPDDVLGRYIRPLRDALEADRAGFYSNYLRQAEADPAAPDDIPDRLREISAIEECHSVAGDENYILKVRVETPTALEDLIAQVRGAAHVSTRTTVVLSTPWE